MQHLCNTNQTRTSDSCSFFALYHMDPYCHWTHNRRNAARDSIVRSERNFRRVPDRSTSKFHEDIHQWHLHQIYTYAPIQPEKT